MCKGDPCLAVGSTAISISRVQIRKQRLLDLTLTNLKVS